MQVQIIGSGGFIGSRLMESLARFGHRPYGVSSAAAGGIDPATGLLPASHLVRPGTQAVVYLSQSPRSHARDSGPVHTLAVNVLSAVTAAQAAIKAGATRFVYASTGNVYMPTFEPASESSAVRRNDWYTLSKLQAEEALGLFRNELEVIVLRLFGVYGPGQTGRLVPNLMERVFAGSPVTLERNPNNPRDVDGLKVSLCYVDDVLGIVQSVISSGGPGILNVAGPQAPSIRALASAIGHLAGRDATFRVLDEFRSSDLVADISLLNRRFNPSFTDLETGLAAMLAGARAQ